MTYLGPYDEFNFFLTLCFIVTKLCLIIWMHTNYFYLILQ